MTYPKHLLIGGLVAMGFDASGRFLLTITHSGRGVFVTETWERVARDPTLAYPDAGKAVGIGPIVGQMIDVQERDERRDQIDMQSPDGRFRLLGDSEGITISEQGGPANRSQPIEREANRTSPAAGSGG